jgi:hypothetical protein
MKVTWDDQPWSVAYHIAALEPNSSVRFNRIEEAVAAIEARIAELGDSQQGGNQELTALTDAFVILRLLRKTVA